MKVLIVIDMLKGFCRKGYPLSLPNSTKKLEEYIIDKLEDMNKGGNKIIFVCDNHLFSDPEIDNPYPPHCMKGTIESEIIEELEPYARKATILTKNTLSIFYNTGLQKILEQINPTEIEVTGVCTDICDLFAVYELRIRGYYTIISKRGVLPLDSEKQDEMLEYYQNRLGAKIID